MNGLIETINSEELFKTGELDSHDEFEVDKFKEKKIMRFKTIDDAVNFTKGFVINYLTPKYGQEIAIQFPMAKSGPVRTIKTIEEGAEEMGKFIGMSPNEGETWLVIPKNRYNEVEEYINQ